MMLIKLCKITFMQLLIVAAFGTVRGQTMLTLKGKVVDVNTGEPLPYASIVIRNTTIGTMANAEGRFVFPIPAGHKEGNLQFFMLGYESRDVLIASLNDEEATIGLKNTPTLLREVVVRDLSPAEILKRAFRNKNKNYPTEPFQFEGYYREVQRADGKSVSFLEAFALVHDDGYHQNISQKFFIKEMRLAESYSNPVAPFWDNKNLLVAFLSQNFVKYNRTMRHYKVKRIDDSTVDGVLVYVLEVDKKYSLWPSLVYVRSDNYAIIRTEENFSTQKDAVRRWKVEDNPMMESFPQVKRLQINYKLVGGKYYPENYRMYFKNIYKDVVQKKEVLTFEIAQQFVVTRLHIDDLENIEPEKALSENVSLKKITMPVDQKFWDFSPIRDTPLDSLIRVELQTTE